MAQTARPISLVSNSDWTASSGSNFYDLIDEAVADDGDYIAHPGGSVGEIVLGITALSDPMSSSTHSVNVRAKYVSIAASLNVVLLDGATVISTDSASLTSSFADYSFTLSSGEADAITDYSNLRLKFVGSGNAYQISQAYFEVPNAASGSGGFTVEPTLFEATGRVWDSPNPKQNGKASDVLFDTTRNLADGSRMWRMKPVTLIGSQTKKVCTRCGMWCSGDFAQNYQGKWYCPDHRPRENPKGPNKVFF